MIKELVDEIKIENLNGKDKFEQYREMIKTIVAAYGNENRIYVKKWYDENANYIDKIYCCRKRGLVLFYRTGAYEDHSPIELADFKDVDFEIRSIIDPRTPVFKSGESEFLDCSKSWQRRFLKLYDLSCGKILKLQSQNTNDHGQLSLKKK